MTPISAPSLVVLYSWLVEFPEDVHKTKKLGINGNNKFKGFNWNAHWAEMGKVVF